MSGWELTIAIIVPIIASIIGGLVVYLAAFHAKRKYILGVWDTFRGLTKLIKEKEERAVIDMAGGRNKHGLGGYFIQPNSPMTLMLKMSQTSRHLDQEKYKDMTEDQKLLLCAMLLLTPWSDTVMGIQNDTKDAVFYDIPSKIKSDDIKFAINEISTSTLVTKYPPNYIVVCESSGRYSVTLEDISKPHQSVKNNITSFPAAINAIVEHHNLEVSKFEKETEKELMAAQKLAKDIAAWSREHPHCYGDMNSSESD